MVYNKPRLAVRRFERADIDCIAAVKPGFGYKSVPTAADNFADFEGADTNFADY